jgi:ABC-type multidrug transport system ATPase subunit
MCVCVAVKQVTLTMAEGQILCVLGPNGAGKSTTIAMLTGLTAPSSGRATVYGLDVVESKDELCKRMGVCPQHDILWGELTAREHAHLFARLKGVPAASVAAEVEAKLAFVGLAQVADVRTGRFSGGMKRRLSVALAAIGDPKVILLDEPTTGMDPVNRSGCWKLIEQLKRDRVVLLTTHSMVEADCLSDNIAIMAFGRVCALGSALQLKNAYGRGYRVAIVAKRGAEAELTRQVQAIVPSAVLLSHAASTMVFCVSYDKQPQLIDLLRWLEGTSANEDAKLRDCPDRLWFSEWGVSHASLEEVFMAVTEEANFGYAKGQTTTDDPVAVSDPRLKSKQPVEQDRAASPGGGLPPFTPQV